jgi:RHS repeat-associated protein
VTFGSSDSDAFTYDHNTGRMATYTFSVNGNADAGTLTWNTNGTLAKLVTSDAIPGTADSQTCTYAYDDIERVSNVTCGTAWVQNFTYDAFGNITKNVPSGDGGLTFLPGYWTTPPTNQFTSLPGVTVSYDANGNLLTDNLNTYTWDDYGKMSTVSTTGLTITITYDAQGRMVENYNGSVYTEFVYGPTGTKLAKCTGQTLIKAFVALPGGAKAIYNASGVLTYYRHSDWLGSSRLTSTQARAMYSSTAYAPFGEQYATAGAADASFTGQDQDTTGNLYDFPARRQSPSQGRWIAPDPAGLLAVNPANPQSWNRYAYVNNNPLKLVDPTGMDGCKKDDTGECVGDDDDDGGGGSGCGTDESGTNPCPTPPDQGGGCEPGVICGDPSQICDQGCQLMQAMQDALLEYQNNSECANLLDGGTGAVANALEANIEAQVDPESGYDLVMDSVADIEVGKSLSGTVAMEESNGEGQPATVTLDSSTFFWTGVMTPEWAWPIPISQMWTVLHETAHGAFDSLADYSGGIVPDNAMLGQTGFQASSLNTANIMTDCGGPQGDAPGDPPSPLGSPTPDVPAVAKPHRLF